MRPRPSDWRWNEPNRFLALIASANSCKLASFGLDNEIDPCYDKTSIEKGRGLGKLTTLRPTYNEANLFQASQIFPSS